MFAFLKFIKEGRNNVEKRREFNLWMRDESFGFCISTRTGEVHFGRVEATSDLQLLMIDVVTDQLRSKGLPIAEALEEQKKGIPIHELLGLDESEAAEARQESSIRSLPPWDN